jgi:hypothetical protein
MLTRQWFLRGAAACVVAIASGGCSQMGLSGGSGGAASGMETYRAMLSAAQEVPTNGSTGSGTAEVTVNPSTMDMTYRVTHSGLTGAATAGHLHGPAGPGQNAGVKVPFPSVGPSPITGSGKLTAEQYADLKAGRYYVNIHTAANPAGEIRGQLSR